MDGNGRKLRIPRGHSLWILQSRGRKGVRGTKEWWLYNLNVTDRTNIICFIIFMMISIALTIVVVKMKLPVWKLQMSMILLHDIAAVTLLIARLING